jgi:hypothetical protein
VTVGSLVADNENANKSLFTLIANWRPWITTIGLYCPTLATQTSILLLLQDAQLTACSW